jgi:hypothetical protein
MLSKSFFERANVVPSDMRKGSAVSGDGSAGENGSALPTRGSVDNM